jgi:protein ImuB
VWPRIITAVPDCHTRPLRLFAHPEPIDVMAPVPDDPPVQFRWRHVLHHVRAASGPERIAWEWWRAIDREISPTDHAARDYYRVESDAGQRFWLYRAGLYQPTQPARWYLHGLFA